MRTRAILTALTLATACTLPIGCQIIAGITSLEVTDGGSSGSTSGGPAAPPCPGGSMPGSACGQECVGNAIVAAGTCDEAGECSGVVAPCQAGTLCLPGPQPSSAPMCVPCGTFPNKSQSTCTPGFGCATCDATGETCVTSCSGTVKGSCADTAATRTVDATTSSAQLQCSGTACDGLTIVCQGPFPCEVVCNGACVGVTLKCSSNGPCKLTCATLSCMDATIECGSNECTATCTDLISITQASCAASCGCTMPGCMPPPMH